MSNIAPPTEPPGKMVVHVTPVPKMNADERQTQVGGNHYKDHAIQPWDIILEYGLDFWEGNAVKYILREKSSEPRIKDLEKARHYIDECIRQERAKVSVKTA